jgi:colanic acid/amylovoran biosynthesis protein
MRILVDSCSYNCQNVGDLAMLTVAVSRLRELFSSASIDVITNAPHLVVRHCGAVGTVPVEGRRQLLAEHLLGRADRWIPGSAWRRVEESLRFNTPALFNASADLKQRMRVRLRSGHGGHGGDAGRDLRRFVDAVSAADLVVVNGAGIMTDAFRDHAFGILATLDLAARRGIPTAMFGQGLGPIEAPDLRRRAADVLPRVSLIAVRESKASVPLLRSLGVDPSRLVVTGDDAIELAMPDGASRSARTGIERRAIGVNVRVAPYAGVAPALLSDIKTALSDAAGARSARLVGIPIAHHGGGMDLDTLRELLEAEDGAAQLDTPGAVIDRIGECRVVVTGSYHGAVFALARGIPAVALVKSPYYAAKMTGLADQFGLGCDVVRLDAADLKTTLRDAIDRAWDSADQVEGPLLEAAAAQVRRGRTAYGRLRDLCSSKVA